MAGQGSKASGRRGRKGYLRRLPEVAVVAGWFAANLFLFGAHATYTLNRDMFGLPFAEMVQRYHLEPAAALVAILIGVALIVPTQALYRIYLTLLFAVAWMTWVQGNFLVWNYGVFDGTAIQFAEHTWIGVAEVAGWLVVVAGLLAWWRRVSPHVPFIAAGLCLLQSALMLSVREPPPAKPKAPAKASDPSVVRNRPELVFEYSSAANVIIYLSDGFQSDIFSEIIAAEPSFAAALDGFTFFADASSNARLTVGAYPAIVSGAMYDGSVPFRTYAQQTVMKDNIGLALRRKGYEIAHVLESGNLYYQPEHNVRPFSFVDRFFADDLAGRSLLDATLFRHAPHFLKPYVYDGTSGVAHKIINRPGRLMKDNQTTTYVDFLNLMFPRMRRRDGPPTFKLFHLLNAHPPLSANEHCEYERMSNSRANYVRTNICSMKLFVRYLARLKQLGVYDSSIIVFLGDHGAKGAGTGIAKVLPALETGDAWPALLVKPANSRGALRTSQAPAQIADVAATLAELTGVDAKFPGRSLFSLAEDETRVRYLFLGQPGDRWERTADLPPPRVELVIRGPVKDAASWSLYDPVLTPQNIPRGVFSNLAKGTVGR